MSVPYTKQVAYLESAGNQWIDTGIVPTSTIRIELQYQYSTGNYTSGCGVCANGASKRFHINTYVGKLHFGSGGSSNWVNTIDQNTDIHSASLSGSGNVLIDGNTYSTNGTVGDFTGYNIYLFRVNGESSYTNGYRIYYCKIYDNNVLVRDFIPVRIGNEGCLYDNVSGELFSNKGTGNFIFDEILEHNPLTSNIRRRLLYAKPIKVYDYLCFTALESGTFSFTIESSIGTNLIESISYSLDGKTWVETPNVNSTLVTITTPTVNAGDKVYWKGNATALSAIRDGNNWRAYFSSTGNFDVSGNIMSLLYGKDMDLPITKIRTFVHAFRNCTKLIHAHELVLPTEVMDESFWGMFYGCTSLVSAPVINVSTLTPYCCGHMFYGCTSLTDITSLTTSTTAGVSCCANMFYNCSSLETIPNNFLPPTSLSQLCYQYMFYGCTSLVNVPSNLLPATILASQCYSNMFNGCTSLQRAPELPALTLVTNCYNSMFRGCNSLNYIKMMATNIEVENNQPLYYWVYQVASNGTFVRNPNATWWVTDVSGIPKGWLLEDGTGQDDEIMVFEDPEAKRVITSRYGGVIPDATYSSHWPIRIKGKVDGEITYRQAAHIATITQAFQNNTELIKFHEFQYFTAIDGSGTGWFQNCKTLQEITLPNKENLRLASNAFMQCRDITVFNNWDKVTYFNSNVFYGVLDPFMTLVASLDLTNIKYWGGSVMLGNTQKTSLYLPNVQYCNNFYDLDNCTLIDIGHDNYIEFGTLLFWGWAAHECNLVFRCPAVIKTNWNGMDMHNSTTSGTILNLYVYEKYYDDYANDAYWSTADNIYKIGGTEWVTQFGSSNEWADYPNGQAPNVILLNQKLNM